MYVRICLFWMTKLLDKTSSLTRCCKIFVLGSGILLAAYRFAAFINASSYYNGKLIRKYTDTVYPHFVRQ